MTKQEHERSGKPLGSERLEADLNRTLKTEKPDHGGISHET